MARPKNPDTPPKETPEERQARVKAAQKVLATVDKSPESHGFDALTIAHATRTVQAATRAAMPSDARAKADFMRLINEAADRIINGGRQTIAGAVERFAQSGDVSTDDLRKGLQYLSECLVRAEEPLNGVVAKQQGFTL